MHHPGVEKRRTNLEEAASRAEQLDVFRRLDEVLVRVTVCREWEFSM
jgi:hypothetical protein